MIIVPVKGEPRHIPYNHPGERPSLGDIQRAVGGPIEMVPLFNRVQLSDRAVVSVVAYCNEEGKGERLPINADATILWRRCMRDQGLVLDDVLVGDVVILMGTPQFMKGDQG